jgi:hypothetical protein
MNKNIHILPTDKPSKLCIDYKNNLCLSESDLPYVKSNEWKTFPQNTYITNDEEIKEGDWFLDRLNQLWKCGKGTLKVDKEIRTKWYKKIILTTDPDLIADGVQAIPDEFLEWFVKNPTCERVEIKMDWVVCDCSCDTSNCTHNYKIPTIIIPEEELKNIVLGNKSSLVAQKFDKVETPKCLTKLEIAKNIASIGIGKEEPKQETLEEASKYACQILREHFIGLNHPNIVAVGDNIGPYDDAYIIRNYPFEWNLFIDGAKWQAEQLFKDDAIKTLEAGMVILLKKIERMYDKEDLKKAFFSGCQSERQIKPRIKCWEEFIEQLKKKTNE